MGGNGKEEMTSDLKMKAALKHYKNMVMIRLDNFNNVQNVSYLF